LWIADNKNHKLVFIKIDIFFLLLRLSYCIYFLLKLSLYQYSSKEGGHKPKVPTTVTTVLGTVLVCNYVIVKLSFNDHIKLAVIVFSFLNIININFTHNYLSCIYRIMFYFVSESLVVVVIHFKNFNFLTIFLFMLFHILWQFSGYSLFF
jgi:hypothetical protein